MNCVHLNGRLTFTPELKTSANGRHYVYFTVANNEKASKDGKSFSSFIRCIAWGKTAELICTVLEKGSRIWIDSGTLISSDYTDKDGQRHYDMKLQVYKFDYVGSKREQNANQDKCEPFTQGGYTSGQSYRNTNGGSAGGWMDMGEDVEF